MRRRLARRACGELSVAHGEMRVVLTLDSERYVALALNGEAGASEPLESLKAMAVVVRTYALENADRHAKEGFNLCDSTHCQALRFGKLLPAMERAVLETAGETLWFGARRASVFYAQNCGGQTEDASQIWRRPREPYLVSHADPWCTRHGAAQWHAEIPVEQMRSVFRSEGWNLPGRRRCGACGEAYGCGTRRATGVCGRRRCDSGGGGELSTCGGSGAGVEPAAQRLVHGEPEQWRSAF
jgi:peptidoglycan hydrolase-like amidase